MSSSPSPIYFLIIGVSPGGLGDALTTELLRRPNIHVLATGLELSHLSHLPQTNRLSRLHIDVTSTSSISAAVSTVSTITNGRLHYLVNNAGYGYMMPLLDADMHAAFFPLLRESAGTVVNQCSIASLTGGRQPYIGSYGATKAAVASLNDTMRTEFAAFGVKVISLVTGDVQTGFWTHTPATTSGLPASSLYAPIRSHVERMLRGETNPPGQHSRERWAAGVVQDLLKPSPSRLIRRGFLAWTLMVVSLLLLVWLLDWIFMRVTKLNELRRTVESEGVKKERQS